MVIIYADCEVVQVDAKHDVELYLGLTEKFLLDLKAKADAL